MNILITGANGFVGSNLIQSLSGDDDFHVYALARNAITFPVKSNVTFIQTDLAQANWLNKIPAKIDAVLYLAQSSQYRNFPEGAADMFRINVAAVAELLNWSAKNKVEKFIYASTGNVYRQSDKLLNENDAVQPASYYAATKHAAEQLLLSYHSIFKTIALRIFSVYGPGQQDMMIPNMISKIKSGEAITLAQNKGIILTPVYITDAVAMLKRTLTTEIESSIYNFSGNETISLGEIIMMIAGKLSLQASITVNNNAINYLAADGGKLFKAINYVPQISMQEGISNVLAMQ